MICVGSNKVLFAIIIAGILSQAIKTIINLVRGKQSFQLSDLIVTGGMPSTHSALVSSLFAVLLFEQGFSAVTVAAFVLFLIVVTDSFGVRRTVGEEGKAIDKIIKKEHLKIVHKHFAKGHEPIEVLAGIALGFFVAILLWFI
ncbi:MAG: divergent PAP2 family protein [archaeon]